MCVYETQNNNRITYHPNHYRSLNILSKNHGKKSAARKLC